MRYFGVVEIAESPIRQLVNAAIYIANPEEKLPAHITVSGPHMHLPEEDNSGSSIVRETVSIIGAGNFFSPSQNTVFLECGFPSVRKVWKKKAYGFHPHLTIYDGDDQHYAAILYRELKNAHLYFRFKSSPVLYRRSEKKQNKLDLLLEFDFGFLADILHDRISADIIRHADSAKRIEWVISLLRHCVVLSS